MTNRISFLLSISCWTYNQSAYISDAMNGFAMQQTNFPFVAVIIDDASTDGEQEVIKSYIEEHFDHSEKTGFREWETEDACWIFARHKLNGNCHFVAVLLKRNLFKEPEKKGAVIKEWTNTKYIAICEGDDYWVDPLKLQKQVSFLEGHEEYSMCFHRAVIKLEGVDESKTGLRCNDIENRDYTATELFVNWIVPTASIVYRREMIEKFVIKRGEWLTRGDIALVLMAAHTGKVRGMPFFMSVYRMQPQSLSHNPAIRGKEVYKLPNHFHCILLNFPLVDKKSVAWNISHAYYSRMKKQNNVLRKIKDFMLFVYWDPYFAYKKVAEQIRKTIKR